jgi:uncharacterized protein
LIAIARLLRLHYGPTHKIPDSPLAVGPPGFDDAQLAEAFSRLLAADKSPVRLSIVHTGGPIESITKLTRGEVQLAITRTDIKIGDSARAVARLHSDPVVILATTRSGAMEFTDLNGRLIGIIGPPEANSALLDTLRRQYRTSLQTVDVQQSAGGVAAALRDQKVSALPFVVPKHSRGCLARRPKSKRHVVSFHSRRGS